MEKIITLESISTLDKLRAIPNSFDESLNDLRIAEKFQRQSTALLSLFVNRAVETFARFHTECFNKSGNINISSVLSHSEWVSKFDLNLEPRMIKSYHRSGKLVLPFLEKGINPPVSKLEKIASILEKKEYQKVLPNAIEKIAKVMDDPIAVENELINEFIAQPKPDHTSGLTELTDYNTAQIAIAKTMDKLKKEEETKKEIKVKEKTQTFSADSFKAILISLNVPTERVNEAIHTYFG